MSLIESALAMSHLDCEMYDILVDVAGNWTALVPLPHVYNHSRNISGPSPTASSPPKTKNAPGHTPLLSRFSPLSGSPLVFLQQIFLHPFLLHQIVPSLL